METTALRQRAESAREYAGGAWERLRRAVAEVGTTPSIEAARRVAAATAEYMEADVSLRAWERAAKIEGQVVHVY